MLSYWEKTTVTLFGIAFLSAMLGGICHDKYDYGRRNAAEDTFMWIFMASLAALILDGFAWVWFAN